MLTISEFLVGVRFPPCITLSSDETLEQRLNASRWLASLLSPLHLQVAYAALICFLLFLLKLINGPSPWKQPDSYVVTCSGMSSLNLSFKINKKEIHRFNMNLGWGVLQP